MNLISHWKFREQLKSKQVEHTMNFVSENFETLNSMIYGAFFCIKFADLQIIRRIKNSWQFKLLYLIFVDFVVIKTVLAKSNSKILEYFKSIPMTNFTHWFTFDKSIISKTSSNYFRLKYFFFNKHHKDHIFKFQRKCVNKKKNQPKCGASKFTIKAVCLYLICTSIYNYKPC